MVRLSVYPFTGEWMQRTADAPPPRTRGRFNYLIDPLFVVVIYIYILNSYHLSTTDADSIISRPNTASLTCAHPLTHSINPVGTVTIIQPTSSVYIYIYNYTATALVKVSCIEQCDAYVKVVRDRPQPKTLKMLGLKWNNELIIGYYIGTGCVLVYNRWLLTKKIYIWYNPPSVSVHFNMLHLLFKLYPS
jgi:hypothetical protein